MTPTPTRGQPAAEPAPAPRPIEELSEEELVFEMDRLQRERTERHLKHQGLWQERERAAQAGLPERVAELDGLRMAFHDECRRLSAVIGRRYELLNEALNRAYERRGVKRIAATPPLDFWAGLS